jgi:hypothetical protein
MLEIVNQLDGFDSRGNIKVGACSLVLSHWPLATRRAAALQCFCLARFPGGQLEVFIHRGDMSHQQAQFIL